MAKRVRPPAPILVTGASGYIGGRLVAALERAGRPVRCLTRRPELAAGRFGPGTEVVAGDVLDRASMRRAMTGVEAACYLVHSLGSRGHFEQAEERAARSFAVAAREADVRRIVYLGGLAHPDELARHAGAGGSAHMRSRLRVGELLRGSGVPTVELRTSIGSRVFEIGGAEVTSYRGLMEEYARQRGLRRLFVRCRS